MRSETQLTALLAQHYAITPTALQLLTDGEKVVYLVKHAAQPAWIVRSYPAQVGQGIVRLTKLLRFLETQAYPAERVVSTIVLSPLVFDQDGSAIAGCLEEQEPEAYGGGRSGQLPC